MSKRKQKKPTVDTPDIVLTPLSECAKWPNAGNPKEHNLPLLIELMQEHGFRDFPTLDELTGKLVEGNGRIEALEGMKRDGLEPPNQVGLRADGEWLVPIIRGMHFGTQERAQAYVLANNRASEAGGYNASRLADVLSQRRAMRDGLRGTGYDRKSAEKMIIASWRDGDEKKSRGGRARREGLKYSIIVECADEDVQAQLLERLEKDGLKCKPLIS